MERNASPSDIRDDEWAVGAPDLTLMTEEAPQRLYRRREGFNGWRWLVRAGAPWRMMPPDVPPWEAVSQQTPRGLHAGVFAAIGPDWRVVLRRAEGRARQPSAALVESRTLPSTPESGPRAGDDGAKRQRGRTVHLAVDPLGHLLGVHVPAAEAQGRAQVAQWAEQGQAVTGAAVEVAFVDQGSTGDRPAEAAAAHGRQLAVVKWPAATKGFVLLPRRWVVERSMAGAARFRRLARDDERWPATRAGFHFRAFVILLRKRFVEMMVQSA
jgi:transposase